LLSLLDATEGVLYSEHVQDREWRTKQPSQVQYIIETQGGTLFYCFYCM